MKRSLLALVGVTAGIAAAAGYGVSRRPTTPTARPADLLAQLPAGDPKAAASDREIARWRQRLQEKPGDARLWPRLGDALMQKFRETLDHRYVDWGEMAYRRALELQPEHSDAMTGLAWVSSERHLFEQAIDWGKKALAISPGDSAAWGLIGDAQMEEGDLDGAFESYQKMLDIRPDLSSYSRGARVLFAAGDTRKAMQLMKLAIDAGGPHAENTAWCRAQLAAMLFEMGMILPAEQMVKDALDAAPQNYHALLTAATLRAARNDPAGALEKARRAGAVAPQQSAPYALIGDILRRQGKNDDAEKAYAQFEAVEAAHPTRTKRDRLALARFLAERGRKLDQAVQIAQENQDVAAPRDLDTVAWCFFQKGRLDEAKAFSRKAMAIGSPDAMTRFHAGMIAARAGDRATASNLLYQALNRNPFFGILEPAEAAQTLKDLGQTPVATAKGSR